MQFKGSLLLLLNEKSSHLHDFLLTILQQKILNVIRQLRGSVQMTNRTLNDTVLNLQFPVPRLGGLEPALEW